MLGTILRAAEARTTKPKTRYNKALQIDPRAAVAANNLAWIDANTNGNLDVALQLAQTAKAQLPNRHEVDDTLGWIYYKKGLSSLAIESLSQQREPPARQPDLQLSPRPRAITRTATRQRRAKSLEKALQAKANFDGADEATQAAGVDQGMNAAAATGSPAISRRSSASNTSSASCSTR